MKPLQAIIVDDHQLFISGLQALLAQMPDVAIVATFPHPPAALEHLESHPTDLIITDISMPEMDGIAFIREARVRQPGVRTMVISMHAEPAVIKMALREKPDAFLLKNTGVEELQAALQNIAAGNRYYTEEINRILIEDVQGDPKPAPDILPTLSNREKEVLSLIAQQYTTGEIAGRIFLSVNTVETYRQNLLKKLRAKNVAGMIAKAYQLGIL